MVKILFLHGYAQHPEEIRSKTRQIQKALPDVEFVFPQSAIELVSYDGDLEDRNRESGHASTRYSWNYAHENMSTHLFNAEASLAHLIPILEEHGPFDGVLGFSQGAAVASALTSLLERGHSQITHPAFKFAVLFCGARPSDASFDCLYKDIRTPSLHLIGRQDVMVPMERSTELAAAFKDATIAYHPGNHFIPQGHASTRLIVDFITSNIHSTDRVGRVTSSSRVLTKDPVSRSASPARRMPLDRYNASRFKLIRRPSVVRLPCRV